MTSALSMRRRAMKVAASGPLAEDTFNRVDSSLLGTSSSGHLWTEDPAFAIIANQAGIESAGDGALADVGVGASDVEASAVVPVLGRYAGITARKTNADNFYLAQSGTGEVDLYKRAAAVWTLLGSQGAAMAAGDTLSLRCAGTAISAKVNGVAVVSVTDSSITTGNRAGLRNGSGDTVIRWDNFRVTAP